MSYSKCFICGADNYSGDETRVSVRRVAVDKETLEHVRTVWHADICDDCFDELDEQFKLWAERLREKGGER